MKKHSILLRDVPLDILKIIVEKQREEKSKKLIGQYSLQKAVYTLIKESQNK